MASRLRKLSYAAVGGVLLLAAALKAGGLAHDVLTAGHALAADRWLTGVLACIELLVAMGLVLLPFARPVRWIAIALFAAFAGVSAAGVWVGEEHCSCFGELPVRPWQALAVDLACIMLLVSMRPAAAQPTAAGVGGEAVGTAARIAGVAGAFVLVVWLEASGALGPVYRQLGPWIDAKAARQARLMLGRPWRAVCGSSIDGELASGHWVVLLFKPGCSRCERALASCRMVSGTRRSGLGGPAQLKSDAGLAHEQSAQAERIRPHTRLAVLVVRGTVWLPELSCDANEGVVVGEVAGGECLKMAPPLVLRLEEGIVKEIAHDCRDVQIR